MTSSKAFDSSSKRTNRLTFHIRLFCGHLSVAHREDVHATEMSGLPVTQLAIEPAHDRAIIAHDQIFRVEHRVGIAREPSPEVDHRALAFDPLAVRCRRRILEHGVIGQQRRQRVRVVPIERLVEPFDNVACDRAAVGELCPDLIAISDVRRGGNDVA